MKIPIILKTVCTHFIQLTTRDQDAETWVKERKRTIKGKPKSSGEKYLRNIAIGS